ncbi:MAG: DedA family protein [Vicinamibacterales bacterium]
MLLLSLVVGTLVSEDLTCIAAGLLIQRGQVGALPATLACAFGILAGDFGLWAIGRACGETALNSSWIARRMPRCRLDELQQWLTRHAAGAILGSRFLPGTRFPLYVIAGFVRMPAAVFGLWALVGTALWTPPLVLLSATLDGTLHPAVPASTLIGWLASLGVAGLMLLTLHLLKRVSRVRGLSPSVPSARA